MSLSKLIEQISFSGGSFLFFVSLPFVTSTSELPEFFITFSYIQIGHAFLSNYIVLPMLTGNIQRLFAFLGRFLISAIMISISIFLILYSKNIVDIDDTIELLDITILVHLLVSQELLRVILSRSGERNYRLSLMNTIRWVISFFALLISDVSVIQALLIGLICSTSIIMVGLKIDLTTVQANKENSSYDLQFATANTIWSFVIVHLISLCPPQMITGYYLARNFLNFTNTTIQFFELHYLNYNNERILRLHLNLRDWRYVILTACVSITALLILVSTYDIIIGRYINDTLLMALVSAILFFQVYSRVSNFCLRSSGVFDRLIIYFLLVFSLMGYVYSTIFVSDGYAFISIVLIGYLVSGLILSRQEIAFNEK